MKPATSPINALFDLPPKAAIRYLEQKYPQASSDWHSVLDDAHNRAFVVAHMANVDLVNQVRLSLIDSLEAGTTYQTWLKNLEPLLHKNGWLGKQILVDSKGNAKAVQMGNNHRLKTIYRTNTAAAYEAGRQQVIFNGRDNDPFKYVMYSAILDNRTRPSHKSLHGTVMLKTDPAWASISPPNGFNCRCTIVELTEGQLEREGYTITDSTGKLSTQIVELKDGSLASRTLFDLPNGSQFKTDIGFNHSPQVLPLQNLFDKALQSEPKLAATVVGRVLSQPALLNELTHEFADFAKPIIEQIPKAGAAKAVIKNTGGHRHVGALSGDVVSALAKKGYPVQTPVLTITGEKILHANRSGKTNPVPVAWFYELPKHLRSPTAVMIDRLKNDDSILLVFDFATDEGYKVVFSLNYSSRLKIEGKKQRVTLNYLTTSQIVPLNNLRSRHYEVVWGGL